MDHPSFVGISLCSGVGMLDEGIRIAFPGARTACYVEWESYAQGCLLARMEEASLEPVPIWSDSLASFPAEQFAQRIDWISAGFPCQPHSYAGKRRGVADERWIWESIADIIRRVGPRFVFLENVRGLLSSSNGSAFGTVLRDLARLGFDVEWTVLRASEVGASHQRARLFILAHRPGERRSEGRAESSRIERRPDVAQRGGSMADTGNRFIPGPGRQTEERTGVNPPGPEHVGEPDCGREWNHQAGSIPWQDTWRSAGGPGRFMVKASSPCVFAPGPQSDLWPGIIADMPHLAPAIEPGVRMLVDGMAYVVDQTRADTLRCAGNGVVALQAAVAFAHLAGRLRIDIPRSA